MSRGHIWGQVLLLSLFPSSRANSPEELCRALPAHLLTLSCPALRYVQEGRFRIEERTLTAFQWLYSPQQHRILSRADLESPSR